jgi:hypothetical protein
MPQVVTVVLLTIPGVLFFGFPVLFWSAYCGRTKQNEGPWQQPRKYISFT